MKAVVLEIKENKAAVLDDTGVVHAVKNKGYEVGQKLEVTEFELKKDEIKSLNTSKISRFTRTAAAVLAVAIIGGGVTAYAAPVSTVTVDGASSIEYKLNLFDRVVGMEATEDDDESFKESISELSKEVRGMKISDAIDATTTRFGDELFEAGDDGEAPELTVKVGGLKRRNKHLSDELDKKASEINSNRIKDVKQKDGEASETDTKNEPLQPGTTDVSKDDGIALNDDVNNNTKPEDEGKTGDERPDNEKKEMPADDKVSNDAGQDAPKDNSGNKPDDTAMSKPDDNGKPDMQKTDDAGQIGNTDAPSDIPQNIGDIQNEGTQAPIEEIRISDGDPYGGMEEPEPPQDEPHEDQGSDNGGGHNDGGGNPGDGGGHKDDGGPGDGGHGGPH